MKNIPLKVVKRLRDEGLNITSIAEIQIGMDDEDIAKLSEKEKAIIITFDKDFGEIIFRSKTLRLNSPENSSKVCGLYLQLS